MPRKPNPHTTEDFELALKTAPNDSRKYLLRLYVTGMTPRSLSAIDHIKTICDEHLLGRYELEIVDVYQQPVLAKGEQIIATPTLIKHLPSPLRRFIGDMSQTDKILLGLDLRPRDKDEKSPPRRGSPK